MDARIATRHTRPDRRGDAPAAEQRREESRERARTMARTHSRKHAIPIQPILTLTKLRRPHWDGSTRTANGTATRATSCDAMADGLENLTPPSFMVILPNVRKFRRQCY